MSDVENSFPPIASGKLFPWYLCLMYVYAFGEKHFCMFNANKVFVLYCIVSKAEEIKKKENMLPIVIFDGLATLIKFIFALIH